MRETAPALMRVACRACYAFIEAGDARPARSEAGLCPACLARRWPFGRAFAANGGGSNPDEGRAARGEGEEASAPESAPPPSSIAEPIPSREIEVVSTAHPAGLRPSPIPAAPQATAGAPKKAEGAPASAKPKPARGTLPFFQVDTAPPKPAPGAEAAGKEERPPDSGIVDIRSLASLEDRNVKPVRGARGDADLLNLSGGLFGNSPHGAFNPPDLNSMTAPPESARSARSGMPARVAPVLPASAVPHAPSSRPPSALAAPKRGARVGWIIGAIVVAASVVLLALKLGQNVNADSSEEPDASATATSATTEAPPSPDTAGRPPEKPATAADAPASPRPTAEPTASTAAQARATATAASPSKPGSATGAPPGAAAASPPPAAPAPAPPPAAAPAPQGGGAEFDKAAARTALAAAASKVSTCKRPDDPSGGAKVSITFAPSGRVTSARITGPPFQGTATGGCIASTFRGVTVPPFDGPPITVTKEVNVR